MDFQNGSDRILYVKVSGKFLPIGCLNSNSISENSEMMQTTTRDNNGWNTSRPMNQSYSLSFDGLQINTTIAGGNFEVVSYDRLKSLKRDKVLIDWKVEGEVSPIVDYGKGYINSISESAVVDEFLSFSGTIEGYGKPLFKQKGDIILNTGDPNEIIATNEDNNLVIKTN